MGFRERSHTIKTFPRHVGTNNSRLKFARKKTFSSIWNRALKTEVRQSRQTDKTMAGKFTNWAFTLNNYTEQELAMIRSMPEFIKQCIWELEKGDADTPHVQGWLKLKLQQRMSYLRSHYLPRAHYTGMTTDEWNQNMKRYVQKQDSTAVGGVVQQRQELPVLFPAIAVEMIVEQIMSLEEDGYYQSDGRWFHQGNERCFDDIYKLVCRRLIAKHRIELLCSRPDVKLAVRSFYKEISNRIRIQQRDANNQASQREDVESGTDGSCGDLDSEEVQEVTVEQTCSDCGTEDREGSS